MNCATQNSFPIKGGRRLNAHVDSKRSGRKRIQDEINKLNNERQVVLEDRKKELTGTETDTLDSAMAEVIQLMPAGKHCKSNCCG